MRSRSQADCLPAGVSHTYMKLEAFLARAHDSASQLVTLGTFAPAGPCTPSRLRGLAIMQSDLPFTAVLQMPDTDFHAPLREEQRLARLRRQFVKDMEGRSLYYLVVLGLVRRWCVSTDRASVQRVIGVIKLETLAREFWLLGPEGRSAMHALVSRV